MFLIRNINTWLLLGIIIFGTAFLSISGFDFYKEIKTKYITTKSEGLKLFPSLFEIDEFKSNEEKINSYLKEKTESNEEILFTKILNLKDEKILASNNAEEVGGFYEDWLEFEEGVVLKEERNELMYGKIISLTYKKGDLAVWTAIEKSFFLNSLIYYIIKQLFLFLIFALILFYTLYYIEKKYLLKPMRELRNTMQELGRKKFEYSENYIPNNFGDLLASFSDIAQDVKKILKNEKELSEIKSEFIATTAHQLRTPLSGINWALETLLKDPKKSLLDSQKNILQKASSKNKELIKIVQELLTTSSIEKGELAYHYEEIDLLEIVKSEVLELTNNAKEVKVDLKFKNANNSIQKFRGDSERMHWVIQNLIENSIRYTEEGGEIEVSVNKKNDNILVSVKDNGMGIEEKDKENVFEKFYRSKKAVEKHNEGNGLGLYIAKRIVEHHGGEMWFESNIDKGTIFYFTVPIET